MQSVNKRLDTWNLEVRQMKNEMNERFDKVEECLHKLDVTLSTLLK